MLGLKYTPITAFAMVGTGLVIVLVAIYILMNAACIGFFARRRSGFRWLSHWSSGARHRHVRALAGRAGIRCSFVRVGRNRRLSPGR